MSKLPLYLVSFGVPLLIYFLWLWKLQSRIRFLPLLLLIIPIVWLLLWPAYYQPAHAIAIHEIGDRSDTIVTGFVFLGWIGGVLGCIVLLLIEIPRSVILWMRRGRAMPEPSIDSNTSSP